VVGKETKCAVVEAMELQDESQIFGSETGSASELAKLIGNMNQQSPEPFSLLYLCGNRRRDELPTLLQTLNVSYQEIVVYETQLLQNEHQLDSVTLVYPSGNSWSWFAFFSPSGVESVAEMISNLHFSSEPLLTSAPDLATWIKLMMEQKLIRIAAIGPTTAKACSQLLGNVHIISSKPTSSSLLEALASYNDNVTI